jgi:hypothetical protein
VLGTAEIKLEKDGVREGGMDEVNWEDEGGKQRGLCGLLGVTTGTVGGVFLSTEFLFLNL